MVAEVFAGISAFSEMLGIAKSLRDMDDVVKRNAAVYDLWEKITATQAQYTAAIDQVSALKEELRRFETWETEKQRYKLTDIGRGLSAYTLKEGMENGEAPHRLCANCYNEGRKSQLQPETRSPGMCNVLVCHHCGSDLYLSGQRQPEHHAMKRQRR